VSNNETKIGRPTKLNDTIREKIIQLAEAGKTEEQIGEITGISTRTLQNWKGKHQDFLLALREAKALADDLVELSLFRKAVGYEHTIKKQIVGKDGDVHEVEEVQKFAPDTTAAIFWLKNRKPDEWREKMEIDQRIETSHVVYEAAWNLPEVPRDVTPPELPLQESEQQDKKQE
jgi:Homeodomain-like domain